MSSPHEIERYLTKYTNDTPRILDAPTGLGKNGYIMRVFSRPSYMIGVDLYLPYLRIVKNHRVYDDVILCDVTKLPLKSGSFDMIVASEIIEHLEEKKGLSLLQEADRVSTHRVMVITPNKPPSREAIPTAEGLNQYEAHRSSWQVSDFKSRGFQVFGIGLYFSRFFGKFEHEIDLLFAYSTALLPNFAAEIVAIKEKTIVTDK